MNKPVTNHYPVQSGFAAIAAIFLVVALAALGAFMVMFSNTQQLTSAQDLQGSRAYWAARAGLEWGIANSGTVAAGGVTSVDCTGAVGTPVTTSLNVETFTVLVSCPRATYVDGDNLNVFRITAVASSGTPGSVGYIERSVSASVCRLQAAPHGFC